MAFAMTINKSQVKSLGTVGMDLCSPVFSHSQFYVAVSRGTNWERIKVLLAEGVAGKTENIVYPDVLLHILEHINVSKNKMKQMGIWIRL